MAKAVALGRHQRALLVEASKGPARVARPGMSDTIVNRRQHAAKTLISMGLITKRYERSPDKKGIPRTRAIIELTELGQALVRQFRRELRKGTKIAWTDNGWVARYVKAQQSEPAVIEQRAANDDEPITPRMARAMGILGLLATVLGLATAA
jgi:hypothetical protein